MFGTDNTSNSAKKEKSQFLSDMADTAGFDAWEVLDWVGDFATLIKDYQNNAGGYRRGKDIAKIIYDIFTWGGGG